MFSLSSENPPNHQLGVAAAPSVRKETPGAIISACANNESNEGWRGECDGTHTGSFLLTSASSTLRELQPKVVLEKPL